MCVAYSSAQQRRELVDAYLAAAVAAGRDTVVLDRAKADDFYGDRAVRDPEGLVREFEKFALAALDSGFTGLAVVVDATGQVVTAAARAAFARVEHLADRVIRSSGTITGLCLYDAQELSADALADLGVLHQHMWPNDTPFHLCADTRHHLRLDGELDLASVGMFERSLVSVDLSAVDGSDAVMIDASNLEFVDVRSLHLLDERASDAGTSIVLRDVRPIIKRLLDVTEVSHVRATVTP